MSEQPSTIRLNKFIAERTGLSRREVDDRIAAGRVKIDGEVATLGARIELPKDLELSKTLKPPKILAASPKPPEITLDGKSISFSNNYIYLALNKPVGYVCSKKRQGSSPTVYELLPKKYRALKTVGRLDRDSSGLILLTNDGDFAYRMTHPRFKKTKIYEVDLDHPLQSSDKQKIISGIQLTDGLSRLGLEPIKSTKPSEPSKTTSVKPLTENHTRFRVTMAEGRNRQIRRTFATLGYEVIKLHRTAFGPYALADLKSGEHKIIYVE